MIYKVDDSMTTKQHIWASTGSTPRDVIDLYIVAHHIGRSMDVNQKLHLRVPDSLKMWLFHYLDEDSERVFNKVTWHVYAPQGDYGDKQA